MAAKRRAVVNPTLFETTERLVPLPDQTLGIPEFVLDVPESIPQLGYGSHQFFRYYGKFPSIVGREIINRFSTPGTGVLDCYAGSGTTLVEAQIAGLPSFGIDINPLAVLACRVKTAYYEVSSLRILIESVTAFAQSTNLRWTPDIRGRAKVDKWFSVHVQDELARLRSAIDEIAESPEKDFVIVAFLAIVRRCSNAFDGEVRPHINKEKKPRSPFQAFEAKCEDMISGLIELNSLRPPDVIANAVLADNRLLSSYSITERTPIGLLVAHPPYLNSFNYLQVFSLEFFWAEGLPSVWNDMNAREIRDAEHVAWPATNENVKSKYYADFATTMKTAASVLAPGGTVAVVVGDATIRGQLEPVHRLMAEELTGSGLSPVEIWYRTTHFGIGKYAYSHRADYHGDAEKKDAIMFFHKVD